MRTRLLFLVLISLFGTVSPAFSGYGDTIGGFPNWQERAIITLTNACRMDPVAFRDKYVGNYPTILLPANYPAVAPVYWNLPLNRSAREHAIDMANNCGLQHNSCNGESTFVRVKRFYTASGTLAENIATGYSDPLATMNQWILDKPSSSSPPAADKSGLDGHRKNIMGAAYHELGTGYAYGPKAYRHFWVQDFGGGTSVYTNRIYSGTHFFFTTDSTAFMANFRDPSGGAPTAASVYIGGQRYDLLRDLQGTYKISRPRAASCRTYYFAFTGPTGTQYRYPEAGYLVTFGEGSCTVDYAVTAPVINRSRQSQRYAGGGVSMTSNGVIRIDGGRQIQVAMFISIDGSMRQTVSARGQGVHLVKVGLDDGSTINGKVLMIR